MKKLLIIVGILVTVGATAAWQQSALREIRAQIDLLTGELAKNRTLLAHEQSELSELIGRLAALKKLAVTIDGSAPASKLGPDTEGWWPTNRLYFYMNKELLPLVRLEDVPRTPQEVRAAGEEFHSDTDYSIENRFLGDGRLNPQMATLLGLTDEEKAAVERIYDTLRRQVQVLEMAKIEKFDPPKSGKDSRSIIARIPSLAAETQPMKEDADKALQDAVGPARAKLLAQQANIFFNRYGDGLGSEEREFIVSNHSLSVLYRDQWGERFKSTTFGPGQPTNWEYDHLFGPGAPGGLK